MSNMHNMNSMGNAPGVIGTHFNAPQYNMPMQPARAYQQTHIQSGNMYNTDYLNQGSQDLGSFNDQTFGAFNNQILGGFDNQSFGTGASNFSNIPRQPAALWQPNVGYGQLPQDMVFPVQTVQPNFPYDRLLQEMALPAQPTQSNIVSIAQTMADGFDNEPNTISSLPMRNNDTMVNTVIPIDEHADEASTIKQSPIKTIDHGGLDPDIEEMLADLPANQDPDDQHKVTDMLSDPSYIQNTVQAADVKESPGRATAAPAEAVDLCVDREAVSQQPVGGVTSDSNEEIAALMAQLPDACDTAGNEQTSSDDIIITDSVMNAPPIPTEQDNNKQIPGDDMFRYSSLLDADLSDINWATILSPQATPNSHVESESIEASIDSSADQTASMGPNMPITAPSDPMPLALPGQVDTSLTLPPQSNSPLVDIAYVENFCAAAEQPIEAIPAIPEHITMKRKRAPKANSLEPTSTSSSDNGQPERKKRHTISSSACRPCQESKQSCKLLDGGPSCIRCASKGQECEWKGGDKRTNQTTQTNHFRVYYEGLQVIEKLYGVLTAVLPPLDGDEAPETKRRRVKLARDVCSRMPASNLQSWVALTADDTRNLPMSSDCSKIIGNDFSFIKPVVVLEKLQLQRKACRALADQIGIVVGAMLECITCANGDEPEARRGVAEYFRSLVENPAMFNTHKQADLPTAISYRQFLTNIMKNLV